jgi:AbrB family looped-hinge helix DNA binding protein
MIGTLDKFGRVLIPKKFRERLGITTNIAVNINDDGNRIVIEALQNDEPVIDKDGLLIFTGKVQGDLKNELISNRSKRINKLADFGDSI